jgi:hypothetical protein
VVVPQTSPKAGADIRNEGTPFRCLGLHTHWKAPAEAQTRFSEDILQSNSTGSRSIQHSQTLQAGQTRLAEPIQYNKSGTLSQPNHTKFRCANDAACARIESQLNPITRV